MHPTYTALDFFFNSLFLNQVCFLLMHSHKRTILLLLFFFARKSSTIP